MLKEKTIYVIDREDVVSFRGNCKEKKLAIDFDARNKLVNSKVQIALISSRYLINGIRQISNSINLVELGLYEEYEKGNYDKLPDTPIGIPYPIICLTEKEYNKLIK